MKIREKAQMILLVAFICHINVEIIHKDSIILRKEKDVLHTRR